MKNFLLKILFACLIFFPSSCLAASFLNSNLSGDIKNFAQNTATYGGYETGGTVSIGSVIAAILTGFYAILGLIFVILIVLAGFKYLNARGDEKKTQEALDQIRHAVIGLVIIVAAYVITYFVFYYLPWSGGVGNPSGG
ncbi:MAG: pilin [Patescibacteria group bacterium]|jgi:cytochrome bd-type quinol oxidase subunit 2